MTRFVLRYQASDFALAAGRAWLFGRDADCDVRVDDPAASRHHARLEITPRAVWLEDLDSRNGLSVNGDRLVGRRQLHPGDWFRIGRIEFSIATPSPDVGVSGVARALDDDASDNTERLSMGDPGEVLEMEAEPDGDGADEPVAEAEFEGGSLTTADAPANPVQLIGETGRRWLHDQASSLTERLTSTAEMIDLLARSGAHQDGGALLGEALDLLASRPGDAVPAAVLARLRAHVATWFPTGAPEGRWRRRLEALDARESSGFEETSKTSRTQIKLALEAELGAAIESGEVVAFYQPIVDLGSGRIAGFEALSRWKHPERGMVPPAQFIPLAESNGLIVPLGQKMLEDACRDLARWRETHGALSMSVNLSSHQFKRPDLTAHIERALETSALLPSALTLEITESAIMDDARAAAHVLVRLRALGVRVSVDDFGTGYSSLSYLHQFPLSALKIDRSFVVNLGRDRHNVEIVRTIITLAHTLNLAAVAEGIETDDQLARLRSLRCDYGQGYLFAKPQSAAGIDTLLARAPKW